MFMYTCMYHFFEVHSFSFLKVTQDFVGYVAKDPINDRGTVYIVQEVIIIIIIIIKY